MRPVEDWAAVGDRVRRARSALRYSQAALAERVGLDRTALVRVESGERNVSALELVRLAEALTLPISYFVSESPAPVAAHRSALAEAGAEGDTGAEAARFFLDVALEEHGRDAEWLLSRGFLAPATPLPAPRISGRSDALELARLARERLGRATEPLGSVAAVAERFGLYIKVVPRLADGASLELREGLGVAVVGSASDPGRRRSTAAHELGHHLWGDEYAADVGVATARDEKEGLVDAFASEFLLPAVVIEKLGETGALPDLRFSLIELSADYRVSWTLAVHSARHALGLDDEDVRWLTARTPLRGDFLEVVGREPSYDLSTASIGPEWRRAVLTAYRTRSLTAERAVELINGSLTVDDLPAVDEDHRP